MVAGAGEFVLLLLLLLRRLNPLSEDSELKLLHWVTLMCPQSVSLKMTMLLIQI